MLVAWIEHCPAIECAHLPGNTVGLVPEYHDDFVAAGFVQLPDLIADKRFAVPIKERFCFAHASGHAGGQENGRDHEL